MLVARSRFPSSLGLVTLPPRGTSWVKDQEGNLESSMPQEPPAYFPSRTFGFRGLPLVVLSAAMTPRASSFHLCTFKLQQSHLESRQPLSTMRHMSCAPFEVVLLGDGFRRPLLLLRVTSRSASSTRMHSEMSPFTGSQSPLAHSGLRTKGKRVPSTLLPTLSRLHAPAPSLLQHLVYANSPMDQRAHVPHPKPRFQYPHGCP